MSKNRTSTIRKEGEEKGDDGEDEGEEDQEEEEAAPLDWKEQRVNMV